MSVCVLYAAYEVYSTYDFLDKLSDEIFEIRRQINNLQNKQNKAPKNSCPIDDISDLKTQEKIKELQTKAYNLIRLRTKAYAMAGAKGLGFSIICTVAAHPLLP